MTTPAPDPAYNEITNIDRFLHEPARLVIMAALMGCESADFQSLLALTGLNKGNLSAQAIKLEEAGYLTVEKGFRGRTPYTLYRLTPAGLQALQTYSSQLRRTLDHLQK